MPQATTPTGSDTAQLGIVAACPKCGGSNAWSLLQTLRSCDFCGSALWWPKDPARPGFLVAEDAIQRPEDLLDVLQTLDAIRERSRLAGIRADRERADGKVVIDRQDDPTLPDVNALKAERRHLFSLGAHHKVLAPYALISGTLAFHALGRSRGELKEYRNLFFKLEEMAPAYQAPWDFRDRGLWTAKQRLRQFTPDDLAIRAIPRRDDPAQLTQLTARWRNQRLLIQPDLDPIVFDSDLIAPSRWWVFRPFHYVHARTPMRDGWFLIDGQFANVAGYPEDEESRRAASRDGKPLEAEEVRGVALHVIGSRCPECGADVSLSGRAELQLCSNCGRLLEPSPNGLQVRQYAIVDRTSLPWWPAKGNPDTVWLPFFRVEMTADFAAFLKEACTVMGPGAPALPAAWPESWIPAFDALNVARYDAWAFEWAGALTRTRPARYERRFFLEEPVEKTNRVLPVTMAWDTLRPILPQLLFELLPKPLQARLNPIVIQKILSSSIQAAKVDLVFVPAPVTTSGERCVLGPSSSVGWIPLRDGAWPPDLQRDVRRALERGKRLGATHDAGGSFEA